MKIQDVIDEVNEAWGEEHEEKRRAIFKRSIFYDPIIIFIGISILYLFIPGIYCLRLVIFQDYNPGEQAGAISVFFNLPYYFSDLRAGIIVSIASILLSLYVSVGKYADSLGGVAGDARRAAYRKFARLVGNIIFSVFIVNFWHGLISGWFQRDRVGNPYSIVPMDMDLSRYGEMPLWSLLFFGWFTAASSNMLTHNEKDTLILNVQILKKVNNLNLSINPWVQIAYCVASKELESEGKIPALSKKPKKNLSGYSGLFVSDYSYSRFRFVYSTWWRWLLYGIVFLVVCAVLSIMDWYLGYIAFGGVMVLLEVAVFLMSENYLYASICRLNMEYERGLGKIYEFFNFFSARIFVEIVRLSLALAMVGAVYVLRIQHFLVIIGLFLIFYIGRWRAAQRIEKGFYDSLISETTKSLLQSSKDFLESETEILKEKENNGNSVNKESGEEPNKGKDGYPLRSRAISLIEVIKDLLFLRRKNARNSVDYLVLAYIYCLMLEVNKYYMDYKNELGRTDLSSNQSELIRYRYSRSTTHKAPKALRRK
ncbi:MAG: hypothetical protein EGW04_07140 [Rothia mucilaginosa]|nr:hypothetical protein [Rothia mucilaginosa]